MNEPEEQAQPGPRLVVDNTLEPTAFTIPELADQMLRELDLLETWEQKARFLAAAIDDIAGQAGLISANHLNSQIGDALGPAVEAAIAQAQEATKERMNRLERLAGLTLDFCFARGERNTRQADTRLRQEASMFRTTDEAIKLTRPSHLKVVPK
jgi:hypothetical protein